MADKIAMYIRLSEEDYDVKKGLADESNSIKSQRMLLKSYINNHSEFNGCEIVEYFDDGTSGTLFRKRDEFQSMIEDAQNGCFNCLIVKDLSRFGRDYLEVGYYTEMLLPMLNIRFISVNDGYDSKNYKGTTGGMEYALKNLMHQLYSMDMSKKTRSALRTRQKAGQYVGGVAPFGYKKDTADIHKLVIDEHESRIVKIIFNMAASGKKGTEIASYLNEHGFETRKKGYLWDSTSVIRIIRKEYYIGNLVQGTKEVVGFGDNKKLVPTNRSKWVIVENAVPTIIGKDLFEKANQAFPRKSHKYTQNQHNNIFVCGYCGCKIKNNKNRTNYSCIKKRVTNNENCKKLSINRAKLEDAVLSVVKEACLLMLERFAVIQSETIAFNSNIKANIEELETEKSRLEKAPMLLYKKYKAQVLLREEFMLEKEKANLRLAEVERQITELTVQLAEVKEPVIEKQDLLNCSQLKSYDSQVLSQIIQEVKIYGEDSIEVIFKCNDFYESCLKALEM